MHITSIVLILCVRPLERGSVIELIATETLPPSFEASIQVFGLCADSLASFDRHTIVENLRTGECSQAVGSVVHATLISPAVVAKSFADEGIDSHQWLSKVHTHVVGTDTTCELRNLSVVIRRATHVG